MCLRLRWCLEGGARSVTPRRCRVGCAAFARTSDWNRVVAFYNESLPQLAALPGVSSAAVGNLVPFGDGRFDERVAARASPAEERRAEYRFVSPGYFSTLRMPLLAGAISRSRIQQTAHVWPS
jgi:hypothetical protein